MPIAKRQTRSGLHPEKAKILKLSNSPPGEVTFKVKRGGSAVSRSASSSPHHPPLLARVAGVARAAANEMVASATARMLMVMDFIFNWSC